MKMKLTLDGIKDKKSWEAAGVVLPSYDIEKVKECNGMSSEKIKKLPLPVVKEVRLIGDNLEFTSTMPRIKLDVPKKKRSNGFINIGTILLLIAIVIAIVLTNR